MAEEIKVEEPKRFGINVGDKDKPETCFSFTGPENSNLWQIYDAIMTVQLHITGRLKDITMPKSKEEVKPKEEVSE